MTNVLWLEQTLIDVPESDEWLSAAELDRFKDLRFVKRRSDWRLGRWTAKRAIASVLEMPECPKSLAAIRIETRLDGSPIAIIHDHCDQVTISISHSGGSAVCAVAKNAAQLGCDLELIERRGEAFLRDYFTDEEQASVARSPIESNACWVTLLWSAKESALKALGLGLRVDTRYVSVALEQDAGTCIKWRALHVRCRTGRMLEGWWRLTGHYVQTIVCSPRSSAPEVINIDRQCAKEYLFPNRWTRFRNQGEKATPIARCVHHDPGTPEES